MIELCPAERAGTPDEVGTVGALLMGPDGGFITGSDFLMDGGVTATHRFGELAPWLARSIPISTRSAYHALSDLSQRQGCPWDDPLAGIRDENLTGMAGEPYRW